MYRDTIGEKLKEIASVICTIMMIISIVGGICIGVLVKRFADHVLYSESGVFIGIVTFIVVAGIGCARAYLYNAALDGFGQLVDDTTAIRKSIDKKPHDLVSPASPSPKSENTPVEYSDTRSTVKCPVCGREQRGDRIVCYSCGAKIDQK